MDFETKPQQTPETEAMAHMATGGSRNHAWRAAVALAVALAIAAGLIVTFPNLAGNLGYLALVVLTPLLAGAVVGLSRPVLGRSVSSASALTLRSALAICLMLDLGFFVIVGFIQTKANDTAPVFVISTAVNTPPGNASPSRSPTPTPPAILEPTGRFDHRQGIDTASGKAILGTTAGGVYVLRLQDFEASHGPDLYVYLSPNAVPTSPTDVMSGLEVSPLKATSGNQNYSLPASFEVGRYKSVVIYCKSFSTIFGYATLA